MSFFIPTARIKKAISGSFIIFLLCPLLLPVFASFMYFRQAKKADAQFAVVEVGPNLVANTTSAIANTATAGFQGSIFGKEFVGDAILSFIVKSIIRQLTAQTVNWINSGFKGNPAFLTDPNQFFLNIGDNVVSKFLSENGTLNQLCSPFKAQVRIALVKNYLNDQNNYSCTIDRVLQNANSTYDQFVNDFSRGGWDAWFSMTQNSQNNPIGAYIEARNEMELQVSLGKYKYNQQLDWGKGFLSYEKCATREVTGEDAVEACINQGGDPDMCEATVSTEEVSDETQCETMTPGTVIEGQLQNALGGTFRQLEVADEINEIVSALMTQLVSRIVGGVGKGLRALTQRDTTNPRAFLEQLANTSPEVQAENAAFQNGVNSLLPPDLRNGNTLGGLSPVVTLNGNDPMTVILGSNFVDPGAVALDTTSGVAVPVTLIGLGTVNTSTVGTYTLTYSFANSSGFTTSITRTVNVIDPGADTTIPTNGTPIQPIGNGGGATI
jgi:hypothetical protein